MALKACDSINPFLYCPIQIVATISGLRERDFIEILLTYWNYKVNFDIGKIHEISKRLKSRLKPANIANPFQCWKSQFLICDIEYF